MPALLASGRRVRVPPEPMRCDSHTLDHWWSKSERCAHTAIYVIKLGRGKKMTEGKHCKRHAQAIALRAVLRLVDIIVKRIT